MLLKLNAGSNKGILYQFCGNWNDLESMVNTGIRLSGYMELTWANMKSLERSERNTTKFASLTRSPGVIIESKSSQWRYAVILDGDTLTDHYKLRPYSFYFRPGVRHFFLEEHAGIDTDDRIGQPYYILSNTEAIDANGVKLTKKEGDDLVRWAMSDEMRDYVNVKVYEPKGYSGNLSEILDEIDLEELMEDDSENDIDLVKRYDIDINLGSPETYDKRFTYDETVDTKQKILDWRAGKRKYLPIRALPSVLYRVAAKTLTESEDRIYPNKKDKHQMKDSKGNLLFKEDGTPLMEYNNVDIKNSLIGVLIPDTQYFTKERTAFEQRNPNVPIYIYRDPWLKPGTTKYSYFKKLLDLNPEVKQLYRWPR